MNETDAIVEWFAPLYNQTLRDNPDLWGDYEPTDPTKLECLPFATYKERVLSQIEGTAMRLPPPYAWRLYFDCVGFAVKHMRLRRQFLVVRKKEGEYVWVQEPNLHLFTSENGILDRFVIVWTH